MAFPTGWPPRPGSVHRSMRYYKTGTGTANYSDNAFLFYDGASADTFTAMPYIRPGDKETRVRVGDESKGGTPIGGGQHVEAQPFNPNVFQRGEGDTFVLAAGVITFKDEEPDRNFDERLIGKEILIEGATTVGNDGTFIVTDVPAHNQLQWANASGASEAAVGTYRIRVIDEATPKAMRWSQAIKITNKGTTILYFSFDGENDHGEVQPGTDPVTAVFRNRYEAGIAVKGGGVGGFAIEAW